jgi:hypothetical protein
MEFVFCLFVLKILSAFMKPGYSVPCLGSILSTSTRRYSSLLWILKGSFFSENSLYGFDPQYFSRVRISCFHKTLRLVSNPALSTLIHKILPPIVDPES